MTSGGSRTARRGILVAVETALALVLLICAGLLFKSFLGLMRVTPGFRVEDTFTMSISLGSDYETDQQRTVFFSEVLDAIERIPGVLSVGAIVDLPLGDVSWRPTVTTPATTIATGVNGHTISTDYFRTLGIELLQGRDFSKGHRVEELPVVIVNQSLAQRLWPTGEVLGQRLRLSPDEATPWVTVVGVVSDIRQRGLHLPAEPELFVPFAQQPWSRMNVVVRHEVDLSSVAGPVRQAVWNIDPNLPIERLQTLDAHISRSVGEPRFFMVLSTCFAVAALLLACAGILGTMFHTVEQRTTEMGIRMALGAAPIDVLGLVLGQGMLHVGIGIALGLVGAYASSTLLSRWIHGVSPHDPFTFMAVSVALAATALVASWIPARRAQKISPATCLRWE